MDTDARLIERWRASDERPEIVESVLEWSLSSGAVGTIDVAKLFPADR